MSCVYVLTVGDVTLLTKSVSNSGTAGHRASLESGGVGSGGTGIDRPASKRKSGLVSLKLAADLLLVVTRVSNYGYKKRSERQRGG